MHEDDVGVAAARHVERLPVPRATTRTLMPLAFSKAGSRWPKRPDCSVEVVEATVMKRSWAWVRPAASRLPGSEGGTEQATGDHGVSSLRKRCAAAVCGGEKKTFGRRLFDDAAAVDENDLGGHALCLAEVVGGHQDARAGSGDLADDAFDLAAAGGVEAGGRLVEDQQFGFQRPGAGQRDALLLAAGEQARRALPRDAAGRRAPARPTRAARSRRRAAP
jgi:hypothetical protein